MGKQALNFHVARITILIEDVVYVKENNLVHWIRGQTYI